MAKSVPLKKYAAELALAPIRRPSVTVVAATKVMEGAPPPVLVKFTTPPGERALVALRLAKLRVPPVPLTATVPRLA